MASEVTLYLIKLEDKTAHIYVKNILRSNISCNIFLHMMIWRIVQRPKVKNVTICEQLWSFFNKNCDVAFFIFGLWAILHIMIEMWLLSNILCMWLLLMWGHYWELVELFSVVSENSSKYRLIFAGILSEIRRVCPKKFQPSFTDIFYSVLIFYQLKTS